MTLLEFERMGTVSVGQLAQLAGIGERRAAERRLAAAGVRVFRSPGGASRRGRAFVMRLALQQAMPEVYEQIARRLMGFGPVPSWSDGE